MLRAAQLLRALLSAVGGPYALFLSISPSCVVLVKLCVLAMASLRGVGPSASHWQARSTPMRATPGLLPQIAQVATPKRSCTPFLGRGDRLHGSMQHRGVPGALPRLVEQAIKPPTNQF